MRRRFGAIWTWLDERLGITVTILPIIVHPVPKGVNWWYVFGSATLVAFLLQVITGVGLAMVYVPSPEAAHETVSFITHEYFLGSVVRGAHYFGAGAMVTLVFIHMTQVFLFGSYKYPRELTWVSGSVLLLLTLGLAFSGQLLPWDQSAYWSVVIAVEQAGKVPIIGGVLMQILLAGWTVGPATLSRFYATHVFLLPALVFLLLSLHLYLVVRLGVSEPPEPGEPVDPKTYRARYEEFLRSGKPFFPDSFWEDAVVALALIMGIFTLAALFGPPELGEVADPTVVLAYPRPYWYFLWYYALLAAIPEVTEAVVIVGLPVLAALSLIALPFIANRGERSPRRRPWAVGAVVFAFIAFLALSYQGYHAPWSPIIRDYQNIPLPPAVLAGLSPQARQGAEVFQAQGCHACHSVGGTGGQYGPDLTNAGLRFTREQLIITILRGRGNMPAYAGIIEPDDLDHLVAFLLTLRGQDGETGAAP